MTDPKIYDLAVTDQSFETDNGLQTAILLSLMTWCRADAEDPVRDANNLMGWWGDSPGLVDVPGDKFGSKLWICQRMPANQATLELARRYAQEALQWLIVDGIAAEIQVEMEIQDNGAGEKVLAGRIGVVRPKSPTQAWFQIWELVLQ